MQQRKRRTEKKAFALVLALALMAFMVLLIVSLATMVSMHVKLSKHTLNAFKARQAAKFAAYQAMGQIQSALGPDQRITANASILSQDTNQNISALDSETDFNWWSSPVRFDRIEVNEVSGAVADNKYWVGVWNSAPGYYPDKQLRSEDRNLFTQKVMDKAITWLVSGNAIASEANVKSGSTSIDVKFRPDLSLSKDDSVKVVTKNSYDSGNNTSSDDVKVPIIELPRDAQEDDFTKHSFMRTRVAWWVSDEGQKASLNAISGLDFKNHYKTVDFRLQSLPFYSGIQGLTIGDSESKYYNVDIEDDGSDESSLMIARNASSLDQLDVISSQDDLVPSKALFHSATCGTKGLLVNVRDGGLKKDLSLGLTQIDGNDDPNIKTTEKEITSMPEYFPRPYGVSGFYNKTTAYPIRFVNDDTQWRSRRANKPTLIEKIGNRRFAGHIFGPQMFTREYSVDEYEKQSFGKNGVVSDWAKIFHDDMLQKDPGGALWDQLRSYYNLRSSNKDTDISARVQTDDRYGAKPVVKRFTIHYVPSLVNWDGNSKGAYGLRLHIIPVLVLWNPYDAKVGKETFYAIRVSSREFQCFYNPIGSFRFAIGYKSGNYFQCLRDLYTERMLFPNASNVANPDFFRQNGFSAEAYGFASRPFGWFSSGSKTSGISNPYNVFTDKTYGYRISQKNAFVGLSKNSGVTWLPFGYGSIANPYERLNASGSASFGSFPVNSVSTPFPVATGKLQDLNNWQGVVNEDNVFPQNNLNNAFGDGSDFKHYARVAKIPLFLNNLYINLSHGSYLSKEKIGNEVIFLGQRGIDAVYYNNTSSSFYPDMYQYRQTPDLSFLVYDSEGLEAGATKVFAMRQPINYFGKHNSNRGGSSVVYNGRVGPNGIMEDHTLEQSPYENFGATMLPIGEGGQWGGCFYVDIPHPELEHHAKYLEVSPPSFPRPSVASNSESGVGGDVQLENQYVLFNLSDLNEARIVDINGERPNLSIQDIYVDMMETTVFQNLENSGAYSNNPYLMSVQLTPLAYGMSKYRGEPSWDTVRSVGVETYPELNLSIWIYKKEGMTFTKMKPRSKTSTYARYSGDFADYVPLLVNMKGKRNFLGLKYQSFPNPAMSYKTSSNPNEQYHNNYHTPAYVKVSSGRAVGEFSSVASLTPPDFVNGRNFYSEIDNLLNGFDLKDLTWEKFSNMSADEKAKFNSRFFLNWLSINPRRHSANVWKLSSAPNLDRGQIGDFLPAARKMDDMVLSRSEVDSNSYASKLNSLIRDDSKYIPYGFIFGIPYADDDSPSEAGAKPIHNRRLFVNGSLLSTYYNYDYNAQIVSGDSQSKRINRTWGLNNKSIIATSVVLNHSSDENKAPGNGLSQMGYKVPSASESTAYIGLSQRAGTDVNALHHILREQEVVHNVANLAGANLNFGTGKFGTTADGHTSTTLNHVIQGEAVEGYFPWHYSYGLYSPESLMTSLAIGNSLCPSRVCPEYSYQVLWLDGSSYINDYDVKAAYENGYGTSAGVRERGEDKHVVYDLSWHLNDALWDEYFFSTLPYRNKELEVSFKDGTNIAYPQNPRIRYINTQYSDTVVSIEDLKYSESSSDAQFDENASKLWVDGAFNVNSTSIDAWKTILSTYYGNSVSGYDGEQRENRNSAPFHRYQAPLKGANQATSSTDITQENKIFTGYRTLSESEIEELAVSIVAHIKDRGPFYSMSDFVNRLVANNSAEYKYQYGDNLLNANQSSRIKFESTSMQDLMRDGGQTYRVGHMQKGVLQAAIDATSINMAYHSRYVIGGDVNSLNASWENDEVFKNFKDVKKVWENWRAIVGPIATGAPTYLMQQDILARLGSFLTVRSDTFKIRAYGEIKNPVSGIVEAKAWCEMVVQRTPDYIDNSNAGNKPTDIYGREKELGFQDRSIDEFNVVKDESNGGLTKLNRQLGRRFKIVSFRWLGDNEI